MTPLADELASLYAQRGSGAYFGEAVTQAQHGLQAAHFAEQHGAPESLVLASLLHDIGHLVEPAPEQLADWQRDARHELSGSRWLAAHFGPEVSEPVRLHVPAKRYLCAIDPGYFRQLSAASVTTLALQGGPMSAAETSAFETEPYWREAVLLRQFDDQGKLAGLVTAPFEHYRGLIERCARRARPVRAVLFDLDGTLINTEAHTDATVTTVAARHGVPGYALPHYETHGRTWIHVAETMLAQTGIHVPVAALAAELLASWNEAVRSVQPIPGAPQALHAAAASGLRLAVVSSSPRSVIDYFVAELGVADCVPPGARVGGDAVHAGKPDPGAFLFAAQALGVEPADALVFEDSRAGLQAARAAGMRSMFITSCALEIAENTAIATATCTDYRALPAQFWAQLRAGGIDLQQKNYR
ncbi:MAG: HAD-IA family hydrolase [Gammaproteobacteria bacterium]|nr:HAD-IA family hydrolase [Gammaproteobacteria bacterium]MDE2252500.1 HAD-IA family hydrolase [Gammaproteobacteria bacterium]